MKLDKLLRENNSTSLLVFPKGSGRLSVPANAWVVWEGGGLGQRGWQSHSQHRKGLDFLAQEQGLGFFFPWVKEGSRKLGSSPSTSATDAAGGWNPKSSFLPGSLHFAWLPPWRRGVGVGGLVFFIKTCGDTKSSNTGVCLCVCVKELIFVLPSEILNHWSCLTADT